MPIADGGLCEESDFSLISSCSFFASFTVCEICAFRRINSCRSSAFDPTAVSTAVMRASSAYESLLISVVRRLMAAISLALAMKKASCILRPGDWLCVLTLPDNVSHVHGRVLSNCAFHRDRVGSARAYHCSWGGIAGAHRWFVFSCKLHVVRCPRVASSAWRIHTTELREALASVSMPARGYEDPYWL